jgi:hypothetical protein
VNQCGSQVPSTPNYFSNAVATNQNNIVGTFTFFDRTAGVGYGGPVIHVQADPLSAKTSVSGNYTFYGRFVGWNASDYREPLGTQWHAPYVNPAEGPRTTLFVWQDPATIVAPFECEAALPAPFPLTTSAIVAMDREENVTLLDSTPLSRVAARIDVGPGGLALPYAAGNVMMTFTAASGGPPVAPTVRQGAVIAVQPHGARAAAVGAFQTLNVAW